MINPSEGQNDKSSEGLHNSAQTDKAPDVNDANQCKPHVHTAVPTHQTRLLDCFAHRKQFQTTSIECCSKYFSPSRPPTPAPPMKKMVSSANRKTVPLHISQMSPQKLKPTKKKKKIAQSRRGHGLGLEPISVRKTSRAAMTVEWRLLAASMISLPISKAMFSGGFSPLTLAAAAAAASGACPALPAVPPVPQPATSVTSHPLWGVESSLD